MNWFNRIRAWWNQLWEPMDDFSAVEAADQGLDPMQWGDK